MSSSLSPLAPELLAFPVALAGRYSIERASAVERARGRARVEATRAEAQEKLRKAVAALEPTRLGVDIKRNV